MTRVLGLSMLALALAHQPIAASRSRPSHSKPGHSRPAAIVKVADNGSALIQQGSTLFAANCAVCHGAFAQGKIGPRIVGKTVGDINHALATVPMMNSLGPKISASDREAIAAFLQSLNH